MAMVTSQSAQDDVIVDVRGVSKRFASQQGIVQALEPTDLTIQRGEIVGILGFSGAGKSTLLRIINRLEEPSSGSVAVHGRLLTGLKGADLRAARASIGMIFQQFNLLAQRSAIDNVRLPLQIAGAGRAEQLQRAREALAIVGLADKEQSYPAQLSGGQRQRVAIARALVNNPDILLSDEATSALDPHTSLSILKFLKRLNRERGMTIAIVTHDIKVATFLCHRAIVMEKGRIIETLDMRTPAPVTALGKFFMATREGWSDDTEVPGEEAAP